MNLFNRKMTLKVKIIHSLATTRLNHKWDVVWRLPIHFPVEEAWFPIVQSRWLGATNVYHKRLFVALSQSYQLYQMTYVKRQKSCWKAKTSFLVVMKECKAKRSSFKINFCCKLSRTLSTATSKEGFASAAAMLDPYERTTSFRLSHSTRHRLSVPPRSVIGYQIFANSCERNRS